MMVAQGDITALIRRLEEATEGSRELDAWIHWLVLDPNEVQHVTDEINEWVSRYDNDPSAVIVGRMSLFAEEAPHYTTSLDAALTLVPEGWYWRVGRTTFFQAWAGVHKTLPDHGQPGVNEFFWRREYHKPDSTPALALCIAALKARAA